MKRPVLFSLLFLVSSVAMGIVLTEHPRAAGAETTTSNLKWYTVSGETFAPTSHQALWGTMYGCLYPNNVGGSSWWDWRASVNLPDGAIAKWLYVGGFYSSSTSGARFLQHPNSSVSDNILASLTLTSSTPSRAGMEIAQTIDYSSNSYVFEWSGSTTQQLCYMQIGYILPSGYGVIGWE